MLDNCKKKSVNIASKLNANQVLSYIVNILVNIYCFWATIFKITKKINLKKIVPYNNCCDNFLF